MAGVAGRPRAAPEELPGLVARFGLSAEGLVFDELPSYDDLNFRVATPAGARYVLKLHNGALECGTRARLEAQDRLIARLSGRGLPVPEVIAGPEGAVLPLAPPEPGAALPHARLLTYLEGDIVPNDAPKTPAFLQGVGEVAGRVAAALDGFEDSDAEWTWGWDMKLVAETVRGKLDFIKDSGRRSLAARLADEYAEALSEAAVASLPHSVLHADLNDTNLLYKGEEVVGILDFGDSIRSCTVFDPAIAAGYYSLGQEDPVAVLCEVMRGYVRAAPRRPSEEEIAAYFQAARGRVLLSVAFSSEYSSLEPDNEYLAHTAEPGWAVLEKLGAVDVPEVLAALRAAAGAP